MIYIGEIGKFRAICFLDKNPTIKHLPYLGSVGSSSIFGLTPFKKDEMIDELTYL